MADTTFTNGVTLTDADWFNDLNRLQYTLLQDPNAAYYLCNGRLTLTSGTPVTTSDVTGAGTLYFTPYKGSKLALYDGSANWKAYNFTELSIALTLTSGKPYDIFCYDNSGTPTLESLVWTNDTTRATALTTQNGVPVKTGATTRRYLGTIYSSGANTTEDSLAKRYVWNFYNRVLRAMRNATETADSWTYTTATWRQANANAANQLDFVRGLDEDMVVARVVATFQNSSAGVVANVGIGLDSTSANATGVLNGVGDSIAVNQAVKLDAEWRGLPGVGRHTMPWLEISAAAGGSSWFGDNGDATKYQCGISGEMPA